MSGLENDYLWVGYIFAGLRILLTYNSSSKKYLELILDLKNACDQIDPCRIDPTQIAAYSSGIEELIEDIHEIRYRYEKACNDHPNVLLELKLKR